MLSNIAARLWRFLQCLAFLMIVAGCGGKNPLGRQAICGNVTLEGQPLDQGAIEFTPVSTNGISSGAIIEGGKYEIPTLKGLPPGKYLVRIRSVVSISPENASASTAHSSEEAPPGMMASSGPLRVERIATDYNRESKIVVEVVDSQDSQFDFDVREQRTYRTK